MTLVLVVAVTFALAALRRCSALQVVTLANFMCYLLFSELYAGAVSGTTVRDDDKAHSLIRRSKSRSDFGTWIGWEPCGMSRVLITFSETYYRHNFYRMLKRVRTQLRVAKNRLKKDQKAVNKIYSKVFKINMNHTLDWLPMQDYRSYISNLPCLDNSKRAARTLTKLYGSLQRFAISFYHLRYFHMYSNIEFAITMIKRNELIDGMHREVIRMLCEVETALRSLGVKLPKMSQVNINMTNMVQASEGDITVMLVQDWGVLKLYRTFLNQWTKILHVAVMVRNTECNHTECNHTETESSRGPAGNGNTEPTIHNNDSTRKHPLALAFSSCRDSFLHLRQTKKTGTKKPNRTNRRNKNGTANRRPKGNHAPKWNRTKPSPSS